MHTRYFKLSCNFRDSIFCDFEDNFYQFLGAFDTENSPTLIVFLLIKDHFEDLYHYPCNSSILGVFKYAGIFFDSTIHQPMVISSSSVNMKYACFKNCDDNSYCLVPLNDQVNTCEHCK